MFYTVHMLPQLRRLVFARSFFSSLASRLVPDVGTPTAEASCLCAFMFFFSSLASMLVSSCWFTYSLALF